jgi:hypothetical protein
MSRIYKKYDIIQFLEDEAFFSRVQNPVIHSVLGSTRYLYRDDICYIINPEEPFDGLVETIINGHIIYSDKNPDINVLTKFISSLKIAKSAASCNN